MPSGRNRANPAQASNPWLTPLPALPKTELSTVDALAQLSFLVQGALERRASERGFSLIQTRLLGVLRDRRPAINELAMLLGLDKSSVSGLVDRAESRGLVRRIPSTVDRRSVLVDLTEDGRTLVREVAARFEDDIATLLEPLAPPDRASLTGLLSRVLVTHAAGFGVELLATAEP
ncbi:MAG TPA: MarR family transcriptional regulator [Solirubrobacteraceae bacterium]|nr:MarR family transcriptional regulator [Solirubrobacteraceae bacterium]